MILDDLRRVYFNLYVIAYELTFMNEDKNAKRVSAPIILTFWELIVAFDVDQIAGKFGFRLMMANPRINWSATVVLMFLNLYWFLTGDRGVEFANEFTEANIGRKKLVHRWGYGVLATSACIFAVMLALH
jgi:hypothetical protein